MTLRLIFNVQTTEIWNIKMLKINNKKNYNKINNKDSSAMTSSSLG